MFCNQCGQKNSSNAKFCCSCGNNLENLNIPTQIHAKSELQQLEGSKISLWNPNATVNWSLLFTPIFGTYLQMKNWQALGELEKVQEAKIWIIITILFVIFLNYGTTLIWNDPEKVITMSRGLGLWYIIIWYFAYAKKQSKYIKESLNNEYQKKGWLIPLGIATIILFTITTIILVTQPHPKNSDQMISNQRVNSDKVFFDTSTPSTQNDMQSNQGIPVDNVQAFNNTASEQEPFNLDIILKAHPDTRAIIDSQDFQNWINQQSPDWRNYYNNVLTHGNSTEVINLLNDYKSSRAY